jgi:hypothetical protein
LNRRLRGAGGACREGEEGEGDGKSDHSSRTVP